ncbi:hypothetical protein PIROE2DRAFT_8547 [Piromyces sp. E2]|nr:hypothetical protein PIROE2DRAFT_8547 [Piromyces sp. E2]|eukprot:OUM64626.1 hypothetical protein PIROE2DRAFT_8547 [Piromyces sp. E2]
MSTNPTLYVVVTKNGDMYACSGWERQYGNNGRLNVVINDLGDPLSYMQFRYISTSNGCYRYSNGKGGYTYKGRLEGEWGSLAYANHRCLTQYGWCYCA